MTSLTGIMTSWSLFQNTVILKRPVVAIFADIIKVLTRFTKKSPKTQEKFKELEIMYQNAIYICISWYKKICWFPVKKMLMSAQLRVRVTWMIHFLDFLWVRYNCAKFHHCRICVTDFREWGPFCSPPLPCAAPKIPILNRVKTLTLKACT